MTDVAQLKQAFVKKGCHGRFVSTHTVAERINARIAQGPGCRNWLGTRLQCGYGQTWRNGRHELAHRIVYELYKGQIPVGLELDHLCRNRACCNPDHLEAVTHRENTLRGETITARAATRTHCPVGHPYQGDNLYVNLKGHRKCNACRRTLQNAKAAAIRGRTG